MVGPTGPLEVSVGTDATDPRALIRTCLASER